MRRATMVILSAVMLLTLVAGPADAGSRLVTKTGPLPLVQGVVIEGACPFPVMWFDRGGRTLTTYYRNDVIVGQRITGTSNVILTNMASGLELTFAIQETQSIAYDLRRGSATTVQIGSSGLFYDPGTISGQRARSPGTAARPRPSGRLDPKTLLYQDVEWQRNAGIEGDVCDMLVTGPEDPPLRFRALEVQIGRTTTDRPVRVPLARIKPLCRSG